MNECAVERRFRIKIDPLAFYDLSKNCHFSSFSRFLEKSQFLLDTLLPPVTLDLINFSKNCNFSSFSQFLEKSQFLLDTLVPFLYHLNLVILAKAGISPFFPNFCYCMQTWTYLLSVTNISGIRSLVTGSYMYH